MMLAAYPVEALLLGLLAFTVGGPIHSGAIFWGCLYGVGQAFGMWAFYAALGTGPISVVAPLAGVLNAAVPVAVGVALGERPGPAASAGVGLAIVAVMLVSREATGDGESRFRFTPKVAGLTTLAGCAFGLDLVFLHQSPHDSKLWPLMFARLSATVVITILAASRRSLRLPRGQSLKLALAIALLDICALVTQLIALQSWLLSLASIMISLYPAATVVLAMIVLRERVTRWQGIGMVMAMGSVAMIAAS
ncbi:EamA family transporter [Mycobacterium sherrisii]|uniref:EamA family transporter n=1 Tax=Mycobacterium sherrisii TaxID=243061 RepID=UPI0039754B37